LGGAVGDIAQCGSAFFDPHLRRAATFFEAQLRMPTPNILEEFLIKLDVRGPDSGQLRDVEAAC
jgi:hypothetical protein